MTAVLWTPQARDDLQAIYDYVTKDSVRYADLVIGHIIDAVGRLQQFPESGRIVPELQRAEIREVLWRSYRIVYRYQAPDGKVQILTVFRAERLFPGLR